MTQDVSRQAGGGGQRLDRWLWAARFFKTRTLARKAIEAGKVEVNETGARRPARTVVPGDGLRIQTPGGTFTVVVEGLNLERRPAPEARTLYTETAASQAERARERERQHERRSAVVFDRERPDRRERRAAIRFRRKQSGGD